MNIIGRHGRSSLEEAAFDNVTDIPPGGIRDSESG